MKEETAIFAAGCFWHIEKAFSNVLGIIETRVGYIGGNVKNPSYEQVSSRKTGHAEAIEIIFDSSKISYSQLLDIFWMIHDPTSLNRQGFDVGTNYRSVIFYKDEEQKRIAINSKNNLQKELGNKKIATQIVKAGEFYPAEEYHQKYFQKHKGVLVCNI